MTRLSHDTIEMVLGRTDIVALIGESVELKRDGSRLKGCCPIHGERTPSLTVYREAGRGWYCYGCQVGGDAIEWIQQLDGLSWRDAIERLAARAGIRLGEGDPYTPPAPPSPDEVAQRRAAAESQAREAREAAAWRASQADRLWADCVSVLSDDDVCAMLGKRGFDPRLVAARDLARVLPTWALARDWARHGRPWQETEWRLIVPMFDALGRLATVRARWRLMGDATYDDGSPAPKAVPPTGWPVKGAVMADESGQLMCAGRVSVPLDVVVVEGEMDWLGAVTHWNPHGRHELDPDPDAWGPSHEAGDGPVVLGIVGGAWTADLAARVPDGSRVAVWTDADDAGDRYAAKITETIKGRCSVVRKRPASPRL